MTVYAYDNAGNVGTGSSTFTIDNTAPIIVSGSPHQVVVPNPITFTWNVIETGGIDYAYFSLTDFYQQPITTTAQVA